MSASELEELAALAAIGLLEDNELEILERQLAAASPEGLLLASGLGDAAVALAGSLAPTEPPASSREWLLKEVSAAPRPQPPAQERPVVSPELTAGFSFVLAPDGWRRHPVPGVHMKELSVDRERGYATVLFRLDPGAILPDHDHSGPEECYIVQGDLQMGGATYRQGDFTRAAAGTHHFPTSTEHGCTLLLVVAASDYGI